MPSYRPSLFSFYLAPHLQRRTDGQQSQEMAEDIMAIQRKLQADKMKADRDAVEKERARLQIELLRDKIERHQRAHEGPVPHEMLEQLAVLEGFRPARAAAAAMPSDPRAAMTQALSSMESEYHIRKHTHTHKVPRAHTHSPTHTMHTYPHCLLATPAQSSRLVWG